MVTFCMRCGVSLPPFAAILIKDGKEIPSPYYICPACGKSAGTQSVETAETQVTDKQKEETQKRR
jgi:DNA-directed RNA polymerase subunit RPC12/RpoP